MLYILKGYVKKETGCNIMQAYKTKTAAKKRYNKMIESGCYELVEILEKENKQALRSHCSGIACNSEEIENMTGKMLSIKIFVTGANLEKLEKIRQYLNSQSDVKSGDVDHWTKSEVYQLLFNDAIENFKFEK